jgi:hypothetical protein
MTVRNTEEITCNINTIFLADKQTKGTNSGCVDHDQRLGSTYSYHLQFYFELRSNYVRTTFVRNANSQVPNHMSSKPRGLLGLSRFGLMPLEAGSWRRWQFGNWEKGEHLPLEAATKQRKWRRYCEH